MKKILKVGLFYLWLFLIWPVSQVLAQCNPDTEISTALGCINVITPGGFVWTIMTLALGIAGGIAFLLIIVGGIQVLTSGGNPERAGAGRELITSAITGLLFIIFAVFILRLIAAEILKIPGFVTV